MFALWYTVLSYKEYRNTICQQLPSQNVATPKETAIVCPLPPKKPETPSKIPSRIPQTPSTPIIITKSPEQPVSPQKMEPPPKPPRAASPHPIRAAEADIEYEEESEESDSDEEDAVLAKPPNKKPFAKSVNEFIDREKM